MIILNSSKDTTIATDAKTADTFITRMVGLLKHEKLDRGEGLLITHCNSLHMFFMKFAIDVIFIDKSNQVVGVVENIKPSRLSKVYWKAASAIEVPIGVIGDSKTSVGDTIHFEHTH